MQKHMSATAIHCGQMFQLMGRMLCQDKMGRNFSFRTEIHEVRNRQPYVVTDELIHWWPAWIPWDADEGSLYPSWQYSCGWRSCNARVVDLILLGFLNHHSSDLASSDYRLFTKLKEYYGGLENTFVMMTGWKSKWWTGKKWWQETSMTQELKNSSQGWWNVLKWMVIMWKNNVVYVL